LDFEHLARRPFVLLNTLSEALTRETASFSFFPFSSLPLSQAFHSLAVGDFYSFLCATRCLYDSATLDRHPPAPAFTNFSAPSAISLFLIHLAGFTPPGLSYVKNPAGSAHVVLNVIFVMNGVLRFLPRRLPHERRVISQDRPRPFPDQLSPPFSYFVFNSLECFTSFVDRPRPSPSANTPRGFSPMQSYAEWDLNIPRSLTYSIGI